MTVLLCQETMDLAKFDGGTSPFITLDACNGERANAVLLALEASSNGDHELWTDLINDDSALKKRFAEQGIENPELRTNIPWDDASVLFTSSVELSNEGAPLQVADALLREKIGRFPWGDGSPLSYMHEFIRPNSNRQVQGTADGYEKIVKLLEVLSQRCGPSHLGHDRYQNGHGGLDIRGFLNQEQVRDLRLALSGRSWSVTADEAIDGGMRDVSRNLIAILRGAERRNVGLILRSHS